jgi:L-asparaginase
VAKIIQKIVVLGTGGTIAGTASSSTDHTGYTAAQIGVAQLLEGVAGLDAALNGHTLVTEQVAQIDSKDMDFATMARVSARCAYWLAQDDVAAVVVTHGTDTLEETAWFLRLTLPSNLQGAKALVMTCAMRPATSSESDGPRNLRDAVTVALDGRARGVLAVCAGDIHSAEHVQKLYSHALNAFGSGDAGCVGQVVDGRVRWSAVANALNEQKTPQQDASIGFAAIDLIVNTKKWPRVEIVHNYAHADGGVVRALLADHAHPVQGLVAAGTGNGTLANGLMQALRDAQSQGVSVLRSTRCTWGSVTALPGDRLQSTPLSPLKARIALVLQLLAAKV